MSDYISREAAIKALCERSEPCFTKNGEPTFIGDYIGAITSIPAADVVERKTGEWVKIPPYNQNYWKCSCCGIENKYAYKDGDVTVYELQDFYCPNCGAKMDGGADDGRD